ncbi:MAG: metallophosphoesterase family protein [Bacteroidetes bacterium]|nr:metallophosphoesterase family protein [Bacteroidota bacterium]
MANSYTKINIWLKTLILCISLFFITSCISTQTPASQFYNVDPPERIILNLTKTPSKSQAVTWRTCNKAISPKAQITTLTNSGNLQESIRTINAVSEKITLEKEKFAYHHSIIFDNLKPNTLYAYRVGTDDNFSEWSQFKTASKKHKPFKFVYLGDPQENIKSLCSWIFRAAYKQVPDADFWLFVGDLVDNGERDNEWDEFFYGLGFIPKTTPMILIPGNHEYPDKRYVHGKDFKLSHLWQPHFTLPENGPSGLEESVYFIDYQEVRFVMLNGNEKLEEQSIWLDKILSKNPQPWTIVAIHQPVYSTAKNRKNSKNKNLLVPIFDKYSVDLVLQGHDHSYSRTYKIKNGVKVEKNDKGTVYVISVCGPKFYPVKTNFKKLMKKAESGRQLFQVIQIDHDHLLYEAFDIKGNIYDSFKLEKQL